MATRFEPFHVPEYLLEQVRSLPEKPGIYQFINEEGTIIYIRKAKNLKRRVSSYFQKTPDNAKLAVLVRKVRSINHVVVDTENDALLLENNLIKRHLPRYNVLLKDDKTYPWICISNEPFPKVFTTRKVIRDGSKYFGPYTSGRIWKNLIDLFRSLYKIRTCNLNLSQENIRAGKYKVCLEYHLGNCLGPCIGLQEEPDYLNQIDQIGKILKGNTQGVIRLLTEEMHRFAGDYQFEKAAVIKEKIAALEQFQSKSTVANTSIKHVDVFSIVADDRAGYINFMKVVDGALVQTHSMELKKRLDETDGELLQLGIIEMRERIQSDAPEIIVPFALDYPLENLLITVPQKGDKKALLDLSNRNARYFKLDRQKQQVKHVNLSGVTRKLATLQKDLRLSDLPVHIECFDNSNIQGTNPVASCIVFKNAVPSKNDYRHFNIKTVSGPDDFASMEEVVYRRYKRMLEEEQSLPQLIIVDGGKGQLSSAMKSIEKLDLRHKVAVIGIAKRLEEIYFPDDSVPLYLDKKSESLRLIQQMRDEAHRFGIGHHRRRREKSMAVSELDQISGIGEQTRIRLLTHFESVEVIKTAGFEQISVVVGPAKARIITGYFKKPAE
ncbi:MAG: excinuclease ABC subunit UvrC [Bacteroidales bacterium]|nr:excinuclease ABC subunit UvrC [Bacteroidales bacterium]